MAEREVLSAYAERELSLIEIWQILVRRKQWVIVTLAVCVAAGLAFVFLKAPVYEASVKLRIGQVAGSGLFEPAEELSARLLAQYGEDVADGVKRERPFLARAAAQKNVAATIELVAEADRPEDAVALLKRIFEDVHKSHFKNYSQNVQFLTERLQNLDKQRVAFQLQYEDTTAMLDRLAQRDPVQASLIMLERGRVSSALNALDAEKPSLMQRLTRPLTQQTELMGEITAPTKPAKPKRALVVALSAVLGLMAGVMLAFVAEFVAKARGAGGPPASVR